MRILYISPEHVSGTLTMFQEAHRRRGNECRFVTLFHSRFDFGEDICLNLPLMPGNQLFVMLKRWFHRLRRVDMQRNLRGYPPVWKPNDPLEAALFRLRDRLIAPTVYRAIKEHDLDSFDIIHLEQGLEFFRDGRVVKKWKQQGKKFVCFYHGTDIRNRGVIPAVEEVADLHLTSEWDLMSMHPKMEYLHLPIDTKKFQVIDPVGDSIRICHAARIRAFKGTETVIKVVENLKNHYSAVGAFNKTPLPVELVLIENVPHSEALELKQSCHIAVDQLTNLGGWGYGMSSLETLAMGIPTLTNIPPEMADRIPNHPFIHVTPETLESELKKLIEDGEYRRRKGKEGRAWVERVHDIEVVTDRLYGDYRREGWIP
jgi:glycosyltransferase involved in cell wall biosynthesis